MCLITIEPAGEILSRTNKLYSLKRNSDGFGYMYADRGRIHAYKSQSLSKAEIVKLSKRNKGLQFVTHHRMTTRGGSTVDLCHPFRVLNHKQHGIDVFMMHNGTFTGVEADGTESDSVAINNHIIKPILAANPNYLYSKEFHRMMSLMCESGNRLCFLDGFGTIIKMGTWHDVDGCKVSNLYSLPFDVEFDSPSSQYPYSTYQNKGTKGSTGKVRSSTSNTVSSVKDTSKGTNGTNSIPIGTKGQGTLLLSKSQAPNVLIKGTVSHAVWRYGALSKQVRDVAEVMYIPRFVESEWLKYTQEDFIRYLNEDTKNIDVAYAYLMNFAFNMNVEETVHAGRINRYELGAMVRAELAIVYGEECGEISQEDINKLYGIPEERGAY